MNITKFFRLSLGLWRSQRTGHNHELNHFEDVRSTFEVNAVSLDDPEVLQLCRDCGIDPQAIALPYRSEGYHDTALNRRLAHTLLTVPVPRPDNANFGKLLQRHLDAPDNPSLGEYVLGADGTLTVTVTDITSVREDRIWFATPNLRLQVSTIRPNDRPITTTTFTSDVRAIHSDRSAIVEPVAAVKSLR